MASWYTQQLKRVRRVHKRVKQQYIQLLEMELEGVVGLELHTCTRHLLLPVDPDSAFQLVPVMREALLAKMTQLRAEGRQLKQDRRESRAQRKVLLQHNSPTPR